jgi:signal transduction histidine kinase/ligand-binding sensor domain-containing protein
MALKMNVLRLVPLLAALQVASSDAVAQSADLPLRHLHHTAWTGDTGPPSGVHVLGRSRDGYLWLSGLNSLLRFDGVRFAVIDSTVSSALASSVSGLFIPIALDRDGVLWIARPDHAIIAYDNGNFRIVLPPAPEGGTDIAIDGAGRRWLYGGGGRLRQIRNGRAERVSLPASLPDTGIIGIVRDTGQGIWIGTRMQGLWHLVGNRAERVSPLDAKPRAEARPLIQARDGTLWAIGSGVGGGLHRLVGSRWIPASSDKSGPLYARAAAEDSTGAVWFGTVGRGAVRWHRGAFEQFTTTDGLSDLSVTDLLLDSSGTIWISTDGGGLDRLRPSAFVTLGRRDGLPFESPYRVAEDESGSLWATGIDSMWPVELRGGALDGRTAAMRVTLARLPAQDDYELLAAARGGGVWFGPRHGGLVRYRNSRTDRWTSKDGLPKDRLWYALETRDSAVWLGIVPRGFGVLRNGRFSNVSLPGDPRGSVSDAVEDARGHLWVAVHDGAYLYEFVGGRLARRLGRAEGLAMPVEDLVLEGGDTLWGRSDSGLVRIAGGRVALVRSPLIAPMVLPESRLATVGDQLWAVSPASIMRLSLAALHAVADGRPAHLQPRTFGMSDGLATPRSTRFNVPTVFRAHDGRLWINTPGGLAVLDPARALLDSIAPTAHIEEVSALGRVFHGDTGIRLPPNPDRVTIHYTAMDAFAFERTRSQYLLEGVDPAWIEGTTPRVATYTRLGPGNYRFRVRAWNEDGVPSAREAVMSFRVLPAWYQMLWFRAVELLLAIAAVAMAGIALQLRRNRLTTERMRVQFETTLAERTRIAGELHDTLLQGFTGLTLRLEGFRLRLAKSSPRDAVDLAGILTSADGALLEARQSLWDMRSPSMDRKDLAEALEIAAREAMIDTPMHLHFEVSGLRRILSPALEATMLYVGREAVRNAVLHASASAIDVALLYTPHNVHLAVSDNGVGVSGAYLDRATTTGHFGVLGMRERAARVGGTLALVSTPGEGTTITLALRGNSEVPSG